MPSQSSQIVVAPRSTMVQPRRCGALEEEFVRDIRVAGVGEHRKQVAGGEEAGAEVRAGGRIRWTSRSAAASRSSSGTSPKDSART